MAGITTHVLDTSLGKPAAGVGVRLERGDTVLSSGVTDADGRCRTLHAESPIPGNYRLCFDTGAYYSALGLTCLYPEVAVAFLVRENDAHYHIPLLLSPHAYTTYRGS